MSDDKMEEFGYKGGIRAVEDVEDAARFMGALLKATGVLNYFTSLAKEAHDSGQTDVSAVGLAMGCFANWAVYEAAGQPDPAGAIESLITAIRQSQAALQAKGTN
jgi:hypothetical protein